MVPELYQVQSIQHDSRSVFTLTLSKQAGQGGMRFQPGQFNMLYQFGYGEVAISISGDATQNDVLVHTIQAVGSVTNSLQQLQAGDTLGVRGPYGTYWPLTKTGCDVLVVAGGVGLAPLRSALYHLAANKHLYGKITLLFGTRTPEDMIYKDDIEQWKKLGFTIELTADHADQQWRGHVGVVTALINRHVPRPQETLAFICGPEIMMKFAVYELIRSNVNESHIYLSMERNMQCAVGFCGHCLYGPHFICKNGPVFCYDQVKSWLTIREL